MPDDGTVAGSTGPGVDRHGNETIDPTRNVLDLVAAAILRQDDLRSSIRDELHAQIDIVGERINGMDRATSLLGDQIQKIPIEHGKQVDSQLAANQRLSDERLTAIQQMFAERTIIFDEKYKSISIQVASLEKVDVGKFNSLEVQLHQSLDSIALQFLERDTRSSREADLNKIALDAAFAAQKESAAQQDLGNQKAIDKSEKATVDALAKLSELQKTTTDNLAGKISDVDKAVGNERTNRDRDLNRIEARITAIESLRIGGAEATVFSHQRVMDAAQIRAYMIAGVGVLIALVTVVILLTQHHV